MAAGETASGAAERGASARLTGLHERLEALQARRGELGNRLAGLRAVDGAQRREPADVPEDWAAIEAQSTEQFQRALHLRHELAESARAIAQVEDEVAAVLESLAATSPDHAERRLVLAQQARENAAVERARAAEFDQ